MKNTTHNRLMQQLLLFWWVIGQWPTVYFWLTDFNTIMHLSKWMSNEVKHPNKTVKSLSIPKTKCLHTLMLAFIISSWEWEFLTLHLWNKKNYTFINDIYYNTSLTDSPKFTLKKLCNKLSDQWALAVHNLICVIYTPSHIL